MWTGIWIGFAIATVVYVALLALLARRHRQHRAGQRQQADDRRELFEGYSAARERAAYYEKRFWGLHAAVEGILSERDGWQHKHEDDVHKFLEGQAVLAQQLTVARTQLSQAVHMINQERAARRKLAQARAAAGKLAQPLAEALEHYLTGPVEEHPAIVLTDDYQQVVDRYYDHIRDVSAKARSEVDDTKQLIDEQKKKLWPVHVAELAERTRDSAPPPPPSLDPPAVTLAAH